MSHDQLFKLVLQTFFAEFFELFFPTEAAQLNFDTVRFLEQEAFTDLPEGAVRRPDVVAEVKTASGETEIIFIHIEVQSERRRDIPFRIFEYFSLLRLRHRRKVFPVVLYLVPGADSGLTVERYNEGVLGRVFLRFEYAVVSLPDLTADSYIEGNGPLAVALSALMRSEQIGRVERKYRALLRLATSTLDDARKVLLATVVERYIALTPQEQQELAKRAAQEGEQTVETLENFVSFYEERGIEKGVEQGIAEGLLQGERRTFLRLMERKFGALPESTVAKVEAMKADELEKLTDAILSATSLEDLGLADAAPATDEAK
ncbi:MAG: Rpn family recombination-promoting nuclease/putative transposase [Armatimonadaceae bacterium]